MGRGKKFGPTGRRNFSTPDQIESGAPSSSRWISQKNKEVSDDEEEEDVEDEELENNEEDKKKGISSLIEISNPNFQNKDKIKASDVDLSRPSELSRREREELEKQNARERFMKMQEQGKTEQSKKDLERLALIRKQREEAAKKREEEKLAKEAKRLESRK